MELELEQSDSSEDTEEERTKCAAYLIYTINNIYNQVNNRSNPISYSARGINVVMSLYLKK